VSGTDVVVTGIGMITPLGATAAATQESWRSGRSARLAPPAGLAGTPLRDARAAVMPPFDPGERLGGRRMLKFMSEAAVLGCIAAREAAADAALRERFASERVGLYAGAGLAGARLEEVTPTLRESTDAEGRFSCRLFGERGLAATNPLLSFKVLANMPACLVSIIEGIRGPNLVFTPWEGQTGYAFVEAWRAVAEGEVDCALAGGADAAAHPFTYAYLRQAGLLGESEMPASAAGYVVMERGGSARRDGRRAYARVLRVEVAASCAGPRDPLAPRMGRSFAAAPAVALGLACTVPDIELTACGPDGQEFRAEVEITG
jgi:3-oxoacyl-[acyl-carrier-protein] synthase II